MDPDRRAETTTLRAGRLARIRGARTVLPEAVALTVLCLASLSALRGESLVVSGDEPVLGSAFWVTTLSIGALVLVVLGGVLLSLSRRLTVVERAAGIASALLVPNYFGVVTPYLAGSRESCAGAGEYSGHGRVLAFSHCEHGPNWVTHATITVWALALIAIFVALGVLAARRGSRPHRDPVPTEVRTVDR